MSYVTYIRSGLNFHSFYDAVNIQDYILNNELEMILEESDFCLIEVPSWHILEGTKKTKTGIKVASVLAEIRTQHLLNTSVRELSLHQTAWYISGVLCLNENNKNDNHNTFLIRSLMLNGEEKIKDTETAVNRIIRIQS